MKKSTVIILFVIIVSILFGCGVEHRNSENYSPVYTQKNSWLKRCENPIKDVDVFYIYPTIFNDSNMINMDINDTLLRLKAQIALNKQIGVYSDDCNVFAPYYRQMSMSVLTMPKDSMNKYFKIGYEDVKDAFVYYLNNHNNNRPFILAGHSQGSQVVLNLMKELFFESKLFDKLVAAYIIGYSVTDEDLKSCPWLKVAQEENETGVIITYNTQSQNADGSPVLLPNANCTNPLSWTTDSANISKENNIGAVFFNDMGDYHETIPHFTNARIANNGALIADDPNISDYSSEDFPKGVYHVYDYSFYYLNLKKNVGERIKSYMAGSK